MWSKIEEITSINRTNFESEDEKLNALIGNRFQPEADEDKNSTKTTQYQEIARIVMKYITTAMNRRRGMQK